MYEELLSKISMLQTINNTVMIMNNSDRPLSKIDSSFPQTITTNSTTMNHSNLLAHQIDPSLIQNINNSITSMNNSELIEAHSDRIQLIADIGYSISLLTLLFALLILTCIKRLRSPKNNLHLQLFISFIIRCWFHLMRNLTVEYDIFGISLWDGWVCKFITTVWQYSLLANYNWILMEGVYLYSLIFFTAVSPYGPSIIGYIVFGWTMPLVCVIPWIIIKASYEDDFCWVTNNNAGIFWILRAPITISILINLFIYVKIVLVLYSKIFAGFMTLQSSRKDTENNYKRLLRSTLVLIPLFGVHYAGLLILHQWAVLNNHEIGEVIWLYTDVFFTSFQGCIVACLYCFLNDEVHQEIKSIFRRLG